MDWICFQRSVITPELNGYPTQGEKSAPSYGRNRSKLEETLGVESKIGKMVVDKNGLKYIRYDFAGFEEQLLNLEADPYETTNFTHDTNYKEPLEKLRVIYENEWFPE